MLRELFLEFLLLICGAYLGLGLLTLVVVLIVYYRRLPVPQRSLREFLGELLEWRSEWKEVAFVIFRWSSVWPGIIADRQHAREVAVKMRELDAQRELRRLEEQERWREEASVRRKAAVPAAKPPRRVRKVVERRQRRRS